MRHSATGKGRRTTVSGIGWVHSWDPDDRGIGFAHAGAGKNYVVAVDIAGVETGVHSLFAPVSEGNRIGARVPEESGQISPMVTTAVYIMYSARIICAARSPMITHGAMVLPV